MVLVFSLPPDLALCPVCFPPPCLAFILSFCCFSNYFISLICCLLSMPYVSVLDLLDASVPLPSLDKVGLLNYLPECCLELCPVGSFELSLVMLLKFCTALEALTTPAVVGYILEVLVFTGVTFAFPVSLFSTRAYCNNLAALVFDYYMPPYAFFSCTIGLAAFVPFYYEFIACSACERYICCLVGTTICDSLLCREPAVYSTFLEAV